MRLEGRPQVGGSEFRHVVEVLANALYAFTSTGSSGRGCLMGLWPRRARVSALFSRPAGYRLDHSSS